MDSANRQFFRAYTVTQAGVWLCVYLCVFSITPLFATGLWPLLDVPESTSGVKAPDLEHDRWISLTNDGRLFLDEQLVTEQALEQGIRSTPRDRHIYVRVDRAARFVAVRRIVRAAQRAGRTHLIFSVRIPRMSLPNRRAAVHLSANPHAPLHHRQMHRLQRMRDQVPHEHDLG